MSFFDFFKAPNIEKMELNNDVEGLIKSLQHNQAIIRVEAAKALHRFNDERAIQALKEYIPGF